MVWPFVGFDELNSADGFFVVGLWCLEVIQSAQCVMLTIPKYLVKKKYIPLWDFIVSSVVTSRGLLDITTYAFL